MHRTSSWGPSRWAHLRCMESFADSGLHTPFVVSLRPFMPTAPGYTTSPIVVLEDAAGRKGSCSTVKYDPLDFSPTPLPWHMLAHAS